MRELPQVENTNSETQPDTATMSVANAEEIHGSKDTIIGAGALLVLAVIFFFIRNAFVNYLVDTLKRSPNNAGLSGWGLFGFLLFGSTIGCIAMVNKSYLTIAVMVPLVSLSVVCLLICIKSASKKK